MDIVTREKVFEVLKDFVVKRTRAGERIEQLQAAYPFHTLFFRDEAILAFKRQRSIVTNMGRSLFPRLARAIAEEKYNDVSLEREFRGSVDGAVADEIDRIITQLRVGQRKPDHQREVTQVLNVQGGKPRELVVRADMYIGDFLDGPFFAEIKTPRPNLDIAAESKKKILTFIALHRDANPQAYLAFAYNPFGTREAYAHPFTAQVMDLRQEVLMGEEFWDKVGGEGTYAELLKIIQRVKKETPIAGGAT